MGRVAEPGSWRGGSEGSVQVPRCQSDYEEYGPEDGKLERGVVADRLGSEDQAGYERHRERDSPVEAARFEWGQGSMARTTSRPSSESVQSALAGQWLQIWGLPR